MTEIYYLLRKGMWAKDRYRRWKRLTSLISELKEHEALEIDGEKVRVKIWGLKKRLTRDFPEEKFVWLCTTREDGRTIWLVKRS